MSTDVDTNDRKVVCNVVSETLGFGVTYADRRAKGRLRYKWIFSGKRHTHRVLNMKVARLTKEISNETGLVDGEHYNISWIDNMKPKIPQGPMYQSIVITI